MITINCEVYLINSMIIELPILEDRFFSPAYFYEKRKEDYLRRKETQIDCIKRSNCSPSLIRRVQDRSNYNRPTKMPKRE